MLIKNQKGFQESFNALEPTAVGAFTMTITDNITSPTPATPHSSAVAQLGRWAALSHPHAHPA
jgi:hypothetical protein